jgi:protein-S-isoprenylcysteine O-methyltransferase Ste14
MWLIAILVLCSLWLISEVFITLRLKSRKTVSNSYDKNSLTKIWIVIIVSVFAGVFIAIEFPRFSELRYFIGVALLILGLLLKYIAVFSLRSNYTSDIAIQHEHQLKTDGIYKKVRHPSYSGRLLSFLGLGLVLGNWISLVIVFVPVVIVFLYRIHIEEKVLLRNFNGDYIDYRKHTKKLIPYIY